MIIQVIWRGVCFKLLDALAKEVGFSYSIEIEATAYGSLDQTTGGWNGMIGDLTNNRTDIAIQLVTKNAMRKKVSHSLI